MNTIFSILISILQLTGKRADTPQVNILLSITELQFNPLSGNGQQNGQPGSNNSSAMAGELFEFVWPFCGIWHFKG